MENSSRSLLHKPSQKPESHFLKGTWGDADQVGALLKPIAATATASLCCFLLVLAVAFFGFDSVVLHVFFERNIKIKGEEHCGRSNRVNCPGD